MNPDLWPFLTPTISAHKTKSKWQKKVPTYFSSLGLQMIMWFICFFFGKLSCQNCKDVPKNSVPYTIHQHSRMPRKTELCLNILFQEAVPTTVFPFLKHQGSDSPKETETTLNTFTRILQSCISLGMDFPCPFLNTSAASSCSIPYIMAKHAVFS